MSSASCGAICVNQLQIVVENQQDARAQRDGLAADLIVAKPVPSKCLR
jgi:hypothetical protein